MSTSWLLSCDSRAARDAPLSSSLLSKLPDVIDESSIGANRLCNDDDHCKGSMPSRPVISVSECRLHSTNPPEVDAENDAQVSGSGNAARPEDDATAAAALAAQGPMAAADSSGPQKAGNGSKRFNRTTSLTSAGSLALASSSSGDIEQVKAAFVALIRYNTMQYFYISALLYSVMIIGFIIFHSSVMRTNEAHNGQYYHHHSHHHHQQQQQQQQSQRPRRQFHSASNRMSKSVSEFVAAPFVAALSGASGIKPPEVSFARRTASNPTKHKARSRTKFGQSLEPDSNSDYFETEPSKSFMQQQTQRRSYSQMLHSSNSSSESSDKSVLPDRFAKRKKPKRKSHKHKQRHKVNDESSQLSSTQPKDDYRIRLRRRRLQRRAAERTVRAAEAKEEEEEEEKRKCRTGSDMKPFNGMHAWLLVFTQLALALLLGAVLALTWFKFSPVTIAPSNATSARKQQTEQVSSSRQRNESTTSASLDRLRIVVSTFGLVLTHLLLHLPLATFQLGAILNSDDANSNQRNNRSSDLPLDVDSGQDIGSRDQQGANAFASATIIARLVRSTFSSSSSSYPFAGEPIPIAASSQSTNAANGFSDLFCILANQSLPVCAFLVLAYASAMLLDSSPFGVKVFAVITMSPYVLWTLLQLYDSGVSNPDTARYVLQASNDNDDDDISYLQSETDRSVASAGLHLFCMLLALVLGALKRHRWMRSVSIETFDKATQLIEAKVSLEQQRQQQETLLLSVLPAYVAEQVKRNMVKKIIGGETGACCVTETVAQLQQQQSDLAPPSLSADEHNRPSFDQMHGPSLLASDATSSLTAKLSKLNICRPSLQRISLLSQRASQMKHSSSTEQPQQQRACFAQLSHTSGAISTVLSPSNQTVDSTGCSNNKPANNNGSSSFVIASSSSAQLPAASQQQSHTHSETTVQQHSPQTMIPILQQTSNNLASSSVRRGFNELYIRTYNNVSLLYGDIVGFTRLCTKLSSSQLVRVLNDLFSYFDHLAERHRIMRIKILGDCYYGVSGIPEFAVMGAKSRASRNDNHAINCVNMGLDMIDYIKCLNVERTSNYQQEQVSSTLAVGADQSRPSSTDIGSKPMPSIGSTEQDLRSSVVCISPMPMFELNMRIGVHTGHIHSGVIGLKKWQFDVWSNDVSIAMHCESSGVAGRVQVTDATIQQLNGAFTFEPSPGAQRDLFLADKDIKTYLIRELVRSNLNIDHSKQGHSRVSSQRSSSNANFSRTASTNTNKSSSISRNKRPSIATQALASGVDNNGNHYCVDHLESPNIHEQEPLKQATDSRRIQIDAPFSGCLENETRDNETDDGKIRAATIETISQTLLAREPIGSRGLNSYALALDHQDFHPISLNFRDTAIDKLFTHRARSIGSQFQELASILLLLFTLLPLINHTLYGFTLSAPLAHSYANLLTYLVIAVWIILYSLGLILNARSRIVEQSVAAASGDSTATRSPSFGSATIDISSPQPDKSVEGSVTRGSLFERIAGSQIVGQVKEFFSNASTVLYLCCRENQMLFRTISLTALAIVIVFQTYLFTSRICPSKFVQKPDPFVDATTRNGSMDNSAKPSSTLSEQYQLSVIFLLMAIDLSMDLFKHITKLILILVIVAAQVIVLVSPRLDRNLFPFDACGALVGNVTSDPATRSNPLTYEQAIDWSTDALILLMALRCLAHARQMEYTQRVNFLWRNRLNVDHEELEYISGINKVLLENILPSHVVRHYMTHSTEHPKPITLPSYMRMSFSNMRSLGDELYHEQHDSVAVMFASIPHFYEFYDESDISKQGLGCIALLNEIICDFDKLLLKNKFSRIEKIKTIGSTYMAAAGLRPSHLNSRNSTASQSYQGSCSNQSTTRTLVRQTASKSLLECPNTLASSVDDRRMALSQQKLNLICMIQFATSLMAALNGINKQSFQVFKLKIGVNTGSVIAGIIGAQRPFYDIWGDCVNIASRMESLGEVGRIQVEERTAKLLMDCLCLETYSIVERGKIDVKGKGSMTTYFVDKRPLHSTTGDAD